jgi:Chlorophyll A-B binding protein
MQTKELKNGRLAMIGIAGQALQTYVTGQGTIEQLQSF